MPDIEWWYRNLTEKGGFDGGEAVPPQAERVREILIEALNSGLGEGSEVEAYAADGHSRNPLFILYRARGSQAEEDLPEPEEVGAILEALDESAYLAEVMTVKVEVKVEPPEVRGAMLEDAFRGLREGASSS